MNKLQAITVIDFVVWGFFLWFDLVSDWSQHNEHSKNIC